MPMYTFRNIEDDEHVTHFIPYDELDDLSTTLKDEGWERVFIAPGLIGMHGGTLSKTSDGWKEVLKKINRNSPGRNTVHI